MRSGGLVSYGMLHYEVTLGYEEWWASISCGYIMRSDGLVSHGVTLWCYIRL